MAIKDKSTHLNSKNTPVAKVIAPVKKKPNPSSNTSVANLSSSNNPRKLKPNLIEKKRESIASFHYSVQIRHRTVGLLKTSTTQKSF